MPVQFLARADAPDGEGVFDVWKVDKVHLAGEMLVDRLLEDVWFTITRKPDGALAFACPKPSDRAFLEESSISMEKLWKKAEAYCMPGEEALSYRHKAADGSVVHLDVEVWDDATPLPDGLRLVDGPVP